MNIEEFNREVLLCDNDEKRKLFVQKYILHGTPVVFDGKEHDYFEFRNRIATKFEVGFHEVFIVGSAKLGFSSRNKTVFNYDSDIDVVIVNENLFEKYFSIITDFQYQLDSSYRTCDLNEKKMYHSFLRYFVKGWMRPDKLPTSFKMDMFKNEWFEFFNSISYGKSEVGNYKVAAGLYKNYSCLEKYHVYNIEEIYHSLKQGEHHD